MQNLSQKLVELRKAKNITQKHLAEKINYSDKVISKWERGESVPDIAALSSIAKFYDLTLDNLTNSCEITKDNSSSDLKTIGNLFHIFLTCLPLIFSVWYLCLFNFTQNDITVIHDFMSILTSLIMLSLALSCILDLILCLFRVRHMWLIYAVFGIICFALLYLLISCFVYGTAAALSSYGFKCPVYCVISTIVCIGYSAIFHRK